MLSVPTFDGPPSTIILWRVYVVTIKITTAVRPPEGCIWSGGEARQHAVPALSSSRGWPLYRCREQVRRPNPSFPDMSPETRVAICDVEREAVHAEKKVSAE